MCSIRAIRPTGGEVLFASIWADLVFCVDVAELDSLLSLRYLPAFIGYFRHTDLRPAT